MKVLSVQIETRRSLTNIAIVHSDADSGILQLPDIAERLVPSNYLINTYWMIHNISQVFV